MTTIANNNFNRNHTHNMQTYPQRPNTFQSYLVPQVVYPRNTAGFNLEFPSLPVTREPFNHQVGKKQDIPRMTHHLSYPAFRKTIEKMNDTDGLFIRDSRVDDIKYLTSAPIPVIIKAVKAFVGPTINTDNLATLIEKFRYEQIAGRLKVEEMVEFMRHWDYYNPQTLSQLVIGMDSEVGSYEYALFDQFVNLLHEHAADLRPRFKGGNRPAVPLNLDNLHHLIRTIDYQMIKYNDDVVALEKAYDDDSFAHDVSYDVVDEDGWQRV